MGKNDSSAWQGSTILTVRKNNEIVLAGDGQVRVGSLILKSNVKNVRRIGDGSVIAGFTGSMVNALILFEALESIVSQSPHQLIRSCVDLSKFWCKDPLLYGLNDMMVVVNSLHSLVLTGTGEVLESEDDIIGIGSGGSYALAAARALHDIEGFSASDIVEKAMNLAADMCVYKNKIITVEKIAI